MLEATEDLRLLILVYTTTRSRTTRRESTGGTWWNRPSGMTEQRRLISKIARAAPSAREQAWEPQYSNARGGTRLQGAESRTARQSRSANSTQLRHVFWSALK
ncbi:hypothetical protein Y032_0338g2946 [Ancylostoma ceylanicum]|uniref:Uncharacterized protein n=1 Tax=Ancylostoma ceylanicum TaxID=53326 RepID=A0A016RYY6_9BILA|nr:hypothetical protein Y032_0338g2946 [Ancylostoma ceylanicum]